MWIFLEILNPKYITFYQKEETDENTEPVSMYVFEGKDYSKEPSAADIDAFEKLILGENTNS